ncbi:SDR family oxidoreductase [Massilia violaceinigra]|uniref:SDR family oxidoreductase n=1 Tax=Massilia violaceinigra TaxID=2045208 RepID=A0ABY3ZYY2_9BURK|nr:SDR family oxidoreductase [Massilia violaceinigra]UOD27680.1 SDR family oxidoreductase [Massilia violaceinigra]
MAREKQKDTSFEGKVVLVTGAAGGIGRAAAVAFGRAGACVVVADTSVDGGHATAAMIVENGGKALFVQCNVTRAAEVEALVDKTVAYYGKLDCAFNNAGIEEEHLPLAEADEALFDRIMNVNVKGTWLCMKYEIRQMLKQGSGSIVNTASVAGLVGAPTQPIYAASKHAVVGMTKTAAAEYAREGIRINSVCPGVVNTPMMGRALEREPLREKKLRNVHPMGRFAEPVEIANAAMWLCSEQSSFVTGHQLAVDGGLTAI